MPDQENVAACQRCAGGIGHDGMSYCEPSCPTLSEPAVIVKELAAHGQFFNEMGGCETCTLPDDMTSRQMQDPANHQPSCLWRRAKELYP